MSPVPTHIVLPAAITREGDWYVARAWGVEVVSQGHTLEEALANLREALELYYEDQPAPEPAPEPAEDTFFTEVKVALPA